MSGVELWPTCVLARATRPRARVCGRRAFAASIPEGGEELVRNALTPKVKVIVVPKINAGAVFLKITSGQLRFSE
jgi:hypothetical protein